MSVIKLHVPILTKDIYIPFEDKYQEYNRGNRVIIKMDDNKEDYARLLNIEEKPRTSIQLYENWSIIRKTTEEDEAIINKHKEIVKTYKVKTLESIKQLELNMFFVDMRISFDSTFVLIIFTSESRVDFRKLVRVIASLFKKKIQMLQIGARDRSKLLGGHGICGQKLCCANHLTEIPSVTMDAAREQNISFKGSESLSGCCEKLKCCLNYEVTQYKKLKVLFPKFGSTVKIDDKEHVIIGMDILNKKIKLKASHSYITLGLDEFNKKIGKKTK